MNSTEDPQQSKSADMQVDSGDCDNKNDCGECNEEPVNNSSENVNIISASLSVKNEIKTGQFANSGDQEVQTKENVPSESPKENRNSLEICKNELQEIHTVSTEMKAKKAEQLDPEASQYHLKWIDWKGEQTPIVTQNDNGPCPLLAIANVLILARKIILPKMQQIISGKQLMEYIGEVIIFVLAERFV